MSDAQFPDVPARAAKEQFSQREKYEALAQKLGVKPEDKESARFDGTFTVAKGETLGQKLLDHYGNTADGRKKMASMLVQLTQAGFDVDYVQAGESFEFKGKDITVKNSKGTEVLKIDLDKGREQVTTKARQAIEDVNREVAASLAMEIYNLYLTARAGAGVENWTAEKDDFITAVMVMIKFASEGTDEQRKKLSFVEDDIKKVDQAAAEHGKGSAEYNIAIINFLRDFKAQMNTTQMAEFWDWVEAYMKDLKGNPQAHEDAQATLARPAKAPDAKAAELSEKVKGLKERTEALQKRYDALHKQYDALSERAQTYLASHSAPSGPKGRLITAYATKTPNLFEDQEATLTRAKDVNGLAQGVDQQGFLLRVAQMQSDLDQVEGALGEIEKHLADHSTMLAELEKVVQEPTKVKEKAPEKQTFEQFKTALDAAFDAQLKANFPTDAKYVAFDLKPGTTAEFKEGQWIVNLSYTITRTDNGDHKENTYSQNPTGKADHFPLDAKNIAQEIIGANHNTIGDYMAKGYIDAVLKDVSVGKPIEAKEYRQNLRDARRELNAIIRKDSVLKDYYQEADFTYDKKSGRGEFTLKYTSVDAAGKRTTTTERPWVEVNADAMAEKAKQPWCVNLKPEWIREFYTIQAMKKRVEEMAAELKAKAAAGELVKANEVVS